MELQFRKLALPVKKGIPSTIDLDGRSVEVVAATESPVTVFDYERFEPVDEVLLMAGLQLPESRQLPLLDAHSRHSTSNVIGSIRGLKVSGGQLIGRAHFSSSPEVEPVWTRVREGHLTDFSIGYRVLESVWIPDGQSQKIGSRTFSGPVRVSTAWEAKELSAVPIGADKDAKARSERNYQIMEHNHIEVEEEHKRPRTLRREAEQKTRNEINEILALGEAHNLTSEASEAVRSGWTLEDFRGYLLEKTASRSQQVDDPGGIPALNLSRRDQQEFSIIRLANAIASGQHDQAGHEFDVCRAHMKQVGKDFDGRRISIPFEALAMPKRDMSTFVDSAGGYMVATNLVGFVDLLRNQSAVMTLGATVLSDLTGDVAIPKQTGAATAYWVSEGGDLTESQQTLGQISLKPHTVGAYTDLTRRFRLQATPDAEHMVRNDLGRVIALAIDLAALNGSGAAGEPLGLLQTTGIGAKTLGTANTPTHGELCDIEAEVSVDNALTGSLAYTSNATIAGKMKQTDVATETGVWVLQGRGGEGDKTSNGYKFLMSNQVPAKYIIFGNWKDMVIGMWSGLDINIDSSTLSTSGGLRIVAMQDCDVALRHAESFAYGYKA